MDFLKVPVAAVKDPLIRWNESIHAHRSALVDVATNCGTQFDAVLAVWLFGLRHGGKLIFFGNGGSAAMAQHFAAECVVRLKADRKPIPAIALGTDAAVLTAIGNDMEFGKVFSRQIEALATPDDVVVALTTSGRSVGVLTAVESARAIGCATTALLGSTLGDMPPMNACIMIPSADTARIQEMHLMLGHMLIAALEKELGLV